MQNVLLQTLAVAMTILGVLIFLHVKKIFVIPWFTKLYEKLRERLVWPDKVAKKHPNRFSTIVLLLSLGLLVVSLWLTRFSSESATVGTMTVNWNWGWFTFFLLIGWLSLSFKQVEPDEIGVLTLFGKPVGEHGPGLIFTPALLTNLVRMKGSDQSQELPAEAGRVDKVNQDNPSPGKVPPIRIVHPEPELAFYYEEKDGQGPGEGSFTLPYSSLSPERRKVVDNDPLNARLTTEVNALLIYCIRSGTQFVIRVSKDGGEKGREVVRERIGDVVTAALQSIMGRITLSEALAHKDAVSKEVLARVERLVGEPMRQEDTNPDWWGLDIRTLQIMLVDPGKGVNVAMSEAVASEFQRRKTVQDAKADRTASIVRGKGTARARLLALTAEAEGAGKLATVAATPGGQFSLQQQAAIEIGKAAKHTLVQTQSGLLGAFAGVGAVLTESANK